MVFVFRGMDDTVTIGEVFNLGVTKDNGYEQSYRPSSQIIHSRKIINYTSLITPQYLDINLVDPGPFVLSYCCVGINSASTLSLSHIFQQDVNLLIRLFLNTKCETQRALQTFQMTQERCEAIFPTLEQIILTAAMILLFSQRFMKLLKACRRLRVYQSRIVNVTRLILYESKVLQHMYGHV